ncbi:DUF1272 domain-containing protein [Rossellomorea aquimaris]|nr:DUF1272 domain-containing protein [Rossellomorea aquimaris]
MGLEMRSTCEKCEKNLVKSDIAFICIHECPFCHECTESMEFVCPNCEGEFVRRPRETVDILLAQDPT